MGWSGSKNISRHSVCLYEEFRGEISIYLAVREEIFVVYENGKKIRMQNLKKYTKYGKICRIVNPITSLYMFKFSY